MARYTCFKQLGDKYHLRLFPCITAICGGDQCASAIISVLDFLTVGLIENLEAAAEKEALIWVRLTIDRLYDMVANLYSIRRIQERLEILSESRLIVLPSGTKVFGRATNTPINMLLNRELIKDALEKKSVLIAQKTPEIPPSNVSTPSNVGNSADKPTAEAPKSTPLKSLGTLENTEEREPLKEADFTPVPSEEKTHDSDATLDIEDLFRILPGKFKRLKGGRSVPKDLLRFRLEALQGISTEEAYQAFDSFSKQDFWEKFDARHRVNAFFVYLQKREGEPEPKPTSPRTEIPVPAAAGPVATGIDFPARWNELVPARPTVWNPARDSWRGAGVFSDPEFAAKFDDLCRTCQKFITAKPDADWVHFRWMIGSKDGHPNWHRVDSDEFHISEKRHGSGMTAEEKGQMTRDLAKQMEEENEARKKAAAQKS